MKKRLLSLLLALAMLLSLVLQLPIDVGATDYEHAWFPAPKMAITQIAYESYSHGSQNAIDFAPGGNVFAPFTGKVTYKDAAWGYVVLQSVDKVYYADGTLDYMTVAFMHDENISNLSVGQTIAQGTGFYQAGGMGNGNPSAYADHVHLSVHKGKSSAITSAGKYGAGNVFAFDAFYINTAKTTSITNRGKVASGNAVNNGAPTNWSSLWRDLSETQIVSIVFDANGGEGGVSYGVTAGEALTIPSDLPTKFGYHFVGWEWEGFRYQPGDTIVPEGDMTLTARWERSYQNLYSQTFDSGDWMGGTLGILQPGAGRWVQVSCDESGHYQFRGLNDTSLDTKASLYDSAGNLLISDDDSGGNWQFKLEYYLEMGLTYYLHIEPYSDNAIGDIYYCISKGYPLFCGDEVATSTYLYRNPESTLSYTANIANWAPEKENFYLQGWHLTPGATVPDYSPNDTTITLYPDTPFTEDSEIIRLYPVWGNASGVTGISVNIGKTLYTWGEDFDWESLTVILHYSDGSDYFSSVWDLGDGISISGFDSKRSGEQTVTFYYGNFNAEFTVVVWPGGECGDNLTWKLDSEGTLTISGTGNMDNYSWGEAPWEDFRDNVNRIVIEAGVTSIGDYAFYCYTYAGWVSIPDSVISIGDYAFTSLGDNSTGVGTLTIPNSVQTIGQFAFAYCNSLTGVVLPANLNKIEAYVFRACTNLQSIILPEGVTSIGDCAFYDCPSLTDVYFEGTAEQWVQISIGAYNETLTSATVHFSGRFPNGKCGDNLTWELVGNILTISGSGAMEDYSAYIAPPPWWDYKDEITSVVIEDGVTYIGVRAFWSIAAQSITIPQSVTDIGVAAIRECSNLTGIWVDADNPNFSNDSKGVLFDKNKTTLIQAPGKLSGDYAIPASVTAVGICAFSNCAGLQSVTLPDGVSVIDNGAFASCTGMQTVTIPKSVSKINVNAFNDCNALKDVYYGGTAAQWAQITMGEYNDPLTSAVLHTDEVITGISVTAPAKTECWVGEALDTAGMVVIANYSDGSTKTVMDYTVFGYDADTAGEQTITVTYGEYTATFTVTVKEIVVTDISVTAPTKTEYWVGEELDTTGMVVTANYSDGSTETVTEGFSTTGFSSTTAGTKTVTVTYEGFAATFCVRVREKILYGDVNGDGEVNTRDRAALTRYLADWEGYDQIDLRAADVNRDGSVDTRDRAILTRYLADWETYPELPYTG